MVRILHIVSSLGTGSGVMSVLMSYHRAIHQKKVQFDYLSFKETSDTFEEEILSLGGRVYHCSKPSLSVRFYREIEGFFKTHSGEYPIVHCHPIYAAAIFAPTAKRYGAQCVIQHSHTTQFGGSKASAVRNQIIQLLFGRRATHFAACSQEAKKLFWWVNPKEVYLMATAIDCGQVSYSPERRQQMRAALGIPEQVTVLGHIGRFCDQKNHRFLLEIFAEYVKRMPESRLLLLGDGPLLPDIRAYARELSIAGQVIFAGRHRNVGDYLSAMDVFLLPSKFEGLGIALVEAQISGLPCFASSAVPGEVRLTRQLSFLNLKAGSAAWARKIAATPLRRERCLEEGDGSFCQIHAAAEALRQYYEALLKP